MHALISPPESVSYISSWQLIEDNFYEPVYTTIEGAMRVAQVIEDEYVFDIAPPYFWVACPTECVADMWYYKEGELFVKPANAEYPVTPTEAP